MYNSQSEAMRREASIKKLPRNKKEALILTQTGSELITVYDSDNHPCGERPRKIVHSQGLFHHVCHLWVYGVWEGIKGVWLQRRSLDRPLYPGFFDLTATGHIDPGETPGDAIIREAREETGITVQADSLTSAPPCRQRYTRTDGGFDDELAYPFLLHIDALPPFKPGNEVTDMVFAHLSDFALAHEGNIPLHVRRTDGSVFSVPNDKLCCLHQEEWDNVRGTVEAMG